MFLAIGDFFKGKEINVKNLSLIGGSNFLITVVLIILGVSIPVLANKTLITYSQIPIELLLSVSGCMLIWRVALLINQCKFLEYLGKNSLVIYLTHGSIYKLLLPMSTFFYKYDNWLISLLTILSIVTVVILLSALISKILNQPKMKFILGKY